MGLKTCQNIYIYFFFSLKFSSLFQSVVVCPQNLLFFPRPLVGPLPEIQSPKFLEILLSCPKYILRKSPICPQYVPSGSVFPICPKYVLNMCPQFPRYSLTMSLQCAQNVPTMSPRIRCVNSNVYPTTANSTTMHGRMVCLFAWFWKIYLILEPIFKSFRI